MSKNTNYQFKVSEQMNRLISKKLREAKLVIRRCASKEGFYASDEYKQYWTRDFVYSLDSLLQNGYVALARSHLLKILENQKATGELPTLLFNKRNLLSLNYWLKKCYLGLKLINCKAFYYFHPSNLNSLSKFHEWVGDSEMLTLIGIKKYEMYSGDLTLSKEHKEKIEMAFHFLEEKVRNKFAFIAGSGWADAMLNYFNKFSLIGQCLLYKTYRMWDKKNKAEVVKKNINRLLWNEKLGYYSNCLGESHFDTLGNALTILEDIAPENRSNKIVENFEIVFTDFGYRNLYPPYRMSECGQRPNTFQNSAIWPFISCHVIIALARKGFKEEAEREFFKITKLKGFNEVYCPLTGKPKGSRNCLWSAALYLQAYDALTTLEIG